MQITPALAASAAMRAAPFDSQVLQESQYWRGFPATRVADDDRLLDNGKVFHRISLSHPD
jgi:hypothetical protein